MAAQIIPFDFESNEVRTLLINDQPWFVAMDVAKALAYSDSQAMTRKLDDDEIQNRQIVGFGNRGATVINESGLYSAILRSRKAEAKRFKKWVTAEVLPAIRKHGRYEDTSNQMNTLIGQTIGTDGFRCLGAVLDGKVRSLPAPVRKSVKHHIWSQVHKAFSVVSAQDIPADKMDAARNFIAAYAIEGEWIGKADTVRSNKGLTDEQRMDIQYLVAASQRLKQNWDAGIGKLLAVANWELYSTTFGQVEAISRLSNAVSKALQLPEPAKQNPRAPQLSANAGQFRDALMDYAACFSKGLVLIDQGAMGAFKKGNLPNETSKLRHRLISMKPSIAPNDESYDAYLIKELHAISALEKKDESSYLVGLNLWHGQLQNYMKPVSAMM